LAAEQLLPLVYDELRRLAGQKLNQEAAGQTLDATALVHEAYLRLVGDQQFVNRQHFFGAAAEAMRRILVDNGWRDQAAFDQDPDLDSIRNDRRYRSREAVAYASIGCGTM